MKTTDVRIGLVVDRWTVLAGPFRKNRITYYTCRCQCGSERNVAAGTLGADSKSCGCLRAEQTSVRKTIHGQNRAGRRARLYGIWAGMLQRCSNQKSNRYALYGGRGIRVCEAWHDFQAFYKWATSVGYAHHLQIDRIDPDGDYRPENCRWATLVEQARNKRTTHVVVAFGESKTLGEWAADPRCSVHRLTIWHRMHKLGWPSERAITESAHFSQKRPA